MRKIQPDRELEKVLINWLQNISEASLEEYFEILENQQIQLLKQQPPEFNVNNIRIELQIIQKLFQQLLTLKRRPALMQQNRMMQHPEP